MLGGRLSHALEGMPKEVQSQSSFISFKDLPGEEMSKDKSLILVEISVQTLLQQRSKLSEPVLPFKNENSKWKKEEPLLFCFKECLEGTLPWKVE